MARITDLLKTGRTFSFEFFPPRNDEEQTRLTRTISDLQPLQPDFVSVTYRGGRSSRERTTRVVIDILGGTRITPMPHLTCVATRASSWARSSAASGPPVSRTSWPWA